MESTRGAALRDFAPSAAFVCLEAFAALSSDALLHHIVRDIGATPAATAVALGASYFAGRGISQLLAPAYLAALEPHRLLEVSALLFGVLAVWLACVPSLLQVAAARFALGIAAGSSEANLLAMPTACAHTGRQRPYALYIAHMSALVGFAFAQAPFAALCSSLGWRHAVLLACTLPGVVILAATRVLRVWMPPRGRPVDATAAGGTGGGSLSFPSDWVGAALAQARKLNFAVRPVAAMAVATQTPLHLLGAGWGVLMLREGLGWSALLALCATTLLPLGAVAGACSVVAAPSTSRAGEQCIPLGAFLLCSEVGLILLLISDGGLAVCAGLLGVGAAHGGALLLTCIAASLVLPTMRPAVAAVIGASVSAVDCALLLLTPAVLGGIPPVAHGDEASVPVWRVRAPSAAPLLLIALVALGGGCALGALWRMLRAPETLESALIASAEVGDAQEVDSARARLLSATGEEGQTRRSNTGAAVDLTLAPELIAHAQPVSSPETAQDVRQKGSIETMSTITGATPPKPYDIEKLLLAQRQARHSGHGSGSDSPRSERASPIQPRAPAGR